MAVLTQASQQWASRPDDERFTSIHEMLEYSRRQRDLSRQGTQMNRLIRAAPVEDMPNAIALTGIHGEAVMPTHWAFGQMCSLVGAPAGYLRQLPSDLAADCLNTSMLQRKSDNVGWLVRTDETMPMAAALTGPGYGRIWNEEVLEAIERRFGDGRTGQFTVPGEFGRRTPITKENTTLFASDRDMFVFLADEVNRIEVPGRRDGQSGELARGFFIQNSEVGSASLKIATFLFDYVCSNRIVWGAEGFKEVAIRHSAGAPIRWLDEIVPALENYAQKSTASITQAIANARAVRFDEDDAVKVLEQRFTKNQAKAIRLAHIAEEDRPIESAWDVVTGATAYARNIKHQDERVALERIAGKVLIEAGR